MSMMSGIHKNISFVEENEDINYILVVFVCLQQTVCLGIFINVCQFLFLAFELQKVKFTWHVLSWEGSEMLFLWLYVEELY